MKCYKSNRVQDLLASHIFPSFVCDQSSSVSLARIHLLGMRVSGRTKQVTIYMLQFLLRTATIAISAQESWECDWMKFSLLFLLPARILKLTVVGTSLLTFLTETARPICLIIYLLKSAGVVWYWFLLMAHQPIMESDLDISSMKYSINVRPHPGPHSHTMCSASKWSHSCYCYLYCCFSHLNAFD